MALSFLGDMMPLPFVISKDHYFGIVTDQCMWHPNLLKEKGQCIMGFTFHFNGNEGNEHVQPKLVASAVHTYCPS